MTISVCDDNINELSLSLLKDCRERDVYGYLIDYEGDSPLETHLYKLYSSYEMNLPQVIELDKKGFATIVGKIISVTWNACSKAKVICIEFLMSPSVRRTTP